MDLEVTTFNFSLTSPGEFLNSSNIATEAAAVEEAFKWTDAEIARLIQVIFRPILIILGTIGNGLTIYIMRRSSLKHLSTCFYMVVLALADSIVLWSKGFSYWVQHLTRQRVNPDMWFDCKLSFFMFYFGRHYSSMLLVLMSLEKCFAVYFPLKSKTVCTVKTAKWVTGVVGVILAGYDSIYFFIVKWKVFESGLQGCVATVDIKKIKFIYPVDSALYSFGPFILMFITNFAIVLKFMTAKCKSIQGNSTESTSQALAKSATRGTAMVVTVSITFIILTSPTALNEALLYVNNLSRHPMYRVFMNVTQYLNHSINGVLYCVVGTRFRKEFLKIFCVKSRPEGFNTSRSRSTSLSIISRSRS